MASATPVASVQGYSYRSTRGQHSSHLSCYNLYPFCSSLYYNNSQEHSVGSPLASARGANTAAPVDSRSEQKMRKGRDHSMKTKYQLNVTTIVRTGRKTCRGVFWGLFFTLAWSLVSVSAVKATDYHIGPGQQYTTIGSVPWYNLKAGDTV